MPLSTAEVRARGASARGAGRRLVGVVLAGPAQSQNGEMVRVDGETELGFHRLRQAPEELVRGLQGRPARLADEVAVGQGSQLVGGGAVPKVGVDDDA